MFLRPIQTIFLLTFKLIFKTMRLLGISKNIPNIIIFNSFYSLFRGLFSITYLLSSTVGIAPTFQVLFNIRRLLRRIAYRGLQPINDFSSVIAIHPNLNVQVLNSISNIFSPYWKECIKYPKLFYNLFNIFFVLNSLGLFKFIFKFIYFLSRITIGSIITTLGILWSESLQTITYLKDFAYFIKDNLEYYFDIIIPTLNTGKDIPNNTISTTISLFGLFILNLVGVTTVLFIIEYFIPGFAINLVETTRATPIIGPIIENMANIFGYIYNNIQSFIINWFSGNNPPTGDNIPSPDIISRSSSTGSDRSEITIKDIRIRTPSPIASSSRVKLEDITPPLSRVNTPFENTDINTFDPGW